jgi:hypothetical protein
MTMQDSAMTEVEPDQCDAIEGGSLQPPCWFEPFGPGPTFPPSQWPVPDCG